MAEEVTPSQLYCRDLPAEIALRSLQWPKWECCSQGWGVAGWGCFLVLGMHLQKSQVFLWLEGKLG